MFQRSAIPRQSSVLLLLQLLRAGLADIADAQFLKHLLHLAKLLRTGSLDCPLDLLFFLDSLFGEQRQDKEERT